MEVEYYRSSLDHKQTTRPMKSLDTYAFSTIRVRWNRSKNISIIKDEDIKIPTQYKLQDLNLSYFFTINRNEFFQILYSIVTGNRTWLVSG